MTSQATEVAAEDLPPIPMTPDHKALVKLAEDPEKGPDLTEAEAKALADAEEIIRKGLQGFIVVGQALLTIQDGMLYRETHRTFASYCEDRWEIGSSQAYRLIDSSKVMQALSPIGDILPANESQCRPLTKIRTQEGELDIETITTEWKKIAGACKKPECITADQIEQRIESVVYAQRFSKNKRKAAKARSNEREAQLNAQSAKRIKAAESRRAKNPDWQVESIEHSLNVDLTTVMHHGDDWTQAGRDKIRNKVQKILAVLDAIEKDVVTPGE